MTTTNNVHETNETISRHPARLTLCAWGVHIFTMTGLACATLALLSLIEHRINLMWLWLGISLVVDGIDGTLARKVRVKEVLPWFDGGILDILIDYITWTFIPAIFMYTHLPMGPKPLAGILAVLILTSSTLCYANEHWKSSDYYFYGFPAAWNIVAVILYVLNANEVWTIGVTTLCIILTIVPSYWTHPFRVKRFMPINIAAIIMWIGSVAWLVATHPTRPLPALIIFWLSGGWFMLSCAIRTFTGPDRPRSPHSRRR